MCVSQTHLWVIVQFIREGLDRSLHCAAGPAPKPSWQKTRVIVITIITKSAAALPGSDHVYYDPPQSTSLCCEAFGNGDVV